ncbi:hypothetical protein H632_c3018p0, partial [Helicosporidium sp. ATCC 50920]
TVPVIVDGPNGPVLLENIDVADYPYTGYSYEIERDGQTLVSIYVGETLVGFVPKDQAGEFTAASGGKTYPINVLPDPPAPPMPPLPPSAIVDIVYGGRIIGSTGDGTVPVIVNGPNGPVLIDNINIADYPYTGFTYEIERDGQTLVSIYVGETLVGFVPKSQAGLYSASSGGKTYPINVLPEPPSPSSPTPPLPPGSVVDIQFGGKTIGSTTGTTVPVIVTGAGGPELLGAVNVAEFPYTGYSYEIERNGQTLVSVYVGQTLVGFVPKAQAGEFSAYSDGQTYPLSVLPDAPMPPLPPAAVVDIKYEGATIGSTTGSTVPAIVSGADGPELYGNIEAANYPYTGYSYEIQREGQTLTSVYVGSVLVGFLPKDQVGLFTAESDGRTYPLDVLPPPPAPPAPPLPPSAIVDILYNGETIGSTTASTIPAIVYGPSGPQLFGNVDAATYPYTGYSYEIERGGQALVSVYV